MTAADVSDEAKVYRILEQMRAGIDVANLTVSRINEGAHAVAYQVHACDGQPILANRTRLMVKLYKPRARLEAGILRLRPGATLDLEMVRGQFNSLAQFSAPINGQVCEGWRIAAPEPLYVCEQPLAMVMSVVPGTSLSVRFARGDVGMDHLSRASHAVILALQKVWSIGRAHGDLTFDNILTEPPTGGGPAELSFVDAGTPESCFVCNSAKKIWSPPIYDLGHVLSNMGEPIARTIREPSRVLRVEAGKHHVTRCMMRGYLETLRSPEQRQTALRELRECARSHVNGFFGDSSTVVAAWRGIRRRFVFRKIDYLIARLENELSELAVSPKSARRPAAPLEHSRGAAINEWTGRKCT